MDSSIEAPKGPPSNLAHEARIGPGLNAACSCPHTPVGAGPRYEFAEVVKTSFCHEPVVVREPGPKGKFLVFHVGRQTCPDCATVHTCSFGNGTTDCRGNGVFNGTGHGRARCYPNGGGYNHSYHDGASRDRRHPPPTPLCPVLQVLRRDSPL